MTFIKVCKGGKRVTYRICRGEGWCGRVYCKDIRDVGGHEGSRLSRWIPPILHLLHRHYLPVTNLLFLL